MNTYKINELYFSSLFSSILIAAPNRPKPDRAWENRFSAPTAPPWRQMFCFVVTIMDLPFFCNKNHRHRPLLREISRAQSCYMICTVMCNCVILLIHSTVGGYLVKRYHFTHDWIEHSGRPLGRYFIGSFHGEAVNLRSPT